METDMTRWVRATILAACLAIPATAHAQDEVVLQGRVIDAENGSPIMGALVVATLFDQGALTDSLGFFALRLTRNGSYALRITQMGYAQMDIELPAEAESRQFTVQLPADPLVIEGLIVLTEQLANRRRGPYGIADVLTQRDLQASAQGTGYELVLMTLPFSRVCGPQTEALCLAGRSAVGEQKTVTVCIDDRAVPGDLMQSILGSVDPRSLYMAEVYSRVGEVRLYTPGYIQRLAEQDSELPPLTFGCTGAGIPRN
jgi:carboxypeptidase-like protein